MYLFKKMDPAESEPASAATEGKDTFDSGRVGRENDALLGWGSRSSDASGMIPSTIGRGKGGSKLTGGSGERGGTAKYTEGPLGSGARSRMASYDSATTLGLPRYTRAFCASQPALVLASPRHPPVGTTAMPLSKPPLH